MEHDYKKVTQLIGWLVLIIAVCLSADLIILSGGSAVNSSGSAQAAGETARSEVISDPEKAQLGEMLSDLLLCGQWPIIDARLSAGRGNPLEPKKLQSRLLFMPGIINLEENQSNNSCLTVREVLNK